MPTGMAGRRVSIVEPGAATPATPQPPQFAPARASLDTVLSESAGLPVSPSASPASPAGNSWSSVRKLTNMISVVKGWEMVNMGPVIGNIKMTRLMRACAKNQPDVVQEVLDDLMRRNDATLLASELQAKDAWAGSSPLHWASFSGNPAIVRALLDAGANPVAINDRGK